MYPIGGGGKSLKKKSIAAVFAVVFTLLMAGQVMAFETWHTGPWTEVKISFDVPCPLGEYVPEWIAPPSPIIYIRDQIVCHSFVTPSNLVTWYLFNGINGKVNFNTGRANLYCDDITIEFYHPAMEGYTTGNADWLMDGFYGNFVLNARGVQMQNLDNVALRGTIWLDGYNLFEGSRIKASVTLYGGMLHLQGTAWIPQGQEPLWAAVFGV